VQRCHKLNSCCCRWWQHPPVAVVIVVALVLVAAAVARGTGRALASLLALLAIPAGAQQSMQQQGHAVGQKRTSSCSLSSYSLQLQTAQLRASAHDKTRRPEQVLQGLLCHEKQAALTSSSLQGCCRSSPCWGSCSRCRTLVPCPCRSCHPCTGTRATKASQCIEIWAQYTQPPCSLPGLAMQGHVTTKPLEDVRWLVLHLCKVSVQIHDGCIT
jgi:hypothetical protein